MENEDSNSCFELLSSQGGKEAFTEVPEEIAFRFKIIDATKTRKFGYKLKAGVELPCLKDVGGLF